jgi:hypothetical protein
MSISLTFLTPFIRQFGRKQGDAILRWGAISMGQSSEVLELMPNSLINRFK